MQKKLINFSSKVAKSYSSKEDRLKFKNAINLLLPFEEASLLTYIGTQKQLVLCSSLAARSIGLELASRRLFWTWNSLDKRVTVLPDLTYQFNYKIDCFIKQFFNLILYNNQAYWGSYQTYKFWWIFRHILITFRTYFCNIFDLDARNLSRVTF